MAPRLSPVLTELDLPLQELHAARLDGEVYVVGDGFAPIDEFEQARHRALSLRAVARPRFIAEMMTAAWIHGASLSPPLIHEFCVSTSARSTASNSHRTSVREVVILEADVLSFDGVMVTTPARTAIDLLRTRSEFTARDAAVVSSLLLVAGWASDDCRSAIDSRYKLAGKRRALARLDLLRTLVRS